MHNLEIALAGTVTDDKHLIHGGVGSETVRLNLDSIAAQVGVTPALLAQAVQTELNKLDATDATPGDGAYEAGFTKTWPIKEDIWFIHLRDNIKAQAGIVAKVTETQ